MFKEEVAEDVVVESSVPLDIWDIKCTRCPKVKGRMIVSPQKESN